MYHKTKNFYPENNLCSIWRWIHDVLVLIFPFFSSWKARAGYGMSGINRNGPHLAVMILVPFGIILSLFLCATLSLPVLHCAMWLTRGGFRLFVCLLAWEVNSISCMTWCSDGAVQTFLIDMSQVTGPQHNCIMGLHGWLPRSFRDSGPRSTASGRTLTHGYQIRFNLVYLITSYSVGFGRRKSRAAYPGRWNTWRESGRSARAPLLLCTPHHIGSRRWLLGHSLRYVRCSRGAGRALWKEEKKIFHKNVKNICLSSFGSGVSEWSTAWWFLWENTWRTED